MNQMLVLDHSSTVAPGDAPGPSWDYPASRPIALGPAVAVWAPTLLLAAAMFALGQPLFGVALGGAALVVHSLLDSRIAVIALVCMLPCDWMVSVIPGVTTASKLVGVMALIVSLPKIIRGFGTGKWDPCLKWMLVFFLWVACGIAWATYPSFAILGLQSLVITWGLALLICVNFGDKSSLRTALTLFAATCAVSAIVFIKTGDTAVIAEGFRKHSDETLIGAHGSGRGFDSNELGRYYGIAVLTSIYFVVTLKGVLRRTFFLGVILILVLALILVKGRALYLAVPTALIGSVVLLKGAGLAKRLMLVFVIAVIGGLAVFVSIKSGFLGEGVAKQFSSIFEKGWYAGNRVYIWQANLQAFVRTGFRGVGIDQMQHTAASLLHTAHNDWLSIMGELGLVGLVCFAGLHLTLFVRTMKIREVNTKMLCMMLFIFINFCGLTQDDFVLKHYTMTIGVMLVFIRLEERTRRATAITLGV